MTKWMIAILATASTLAFAGCAASTRTVWFKNDASRQDFNRDRYACAVAHQPGWSIPGTGILGIMSADDAEDRANELRRACPRAQGWERTEVPATSAVGFQEDDD
jgi:hypothetical protein